MMAFLSSSSCLKLLQLFLYYAGEVFELAGTVSLGPVVLNLWIYNFPKYWYLGASEMTLSFRFS